MTGPQTAAVAYVLLLTCATLILFVFIFLNLWFRRAMKHSQMRNCPKVPDIDADNQAGLQRRSYCSSSRKLGVLLSGHLSADCFAPRM